MHAEDDPIARFHEVGDEQLHAGGAGARNRQRERVLRAKQRAQTLLHTFEHGQERRIQVAKQRRRLRHAHSRTGRGRARARTALQVAQTASTKAPLRMELRSERLHLGEPDRGATHGQRQKDRHCRGSTPRRIRVGNTASNTQQPILAITQLGQPRPDLWAKPMPATSMANKPIPCSARNKPAGFFSLPAVAKMPPRPQNRNTIDDVKDAVQLRRHGRDYVARPRRANLDLGFCARGSDDLERGLRVDSRHARAQAPTVRDSAHTRATDGPLVVAHRGDSRNHAENTLRAFLAARELGVPMQEFDVRATRDGELVCMHDETPDRTTDAAQKLGPGALLANLRRDELQKLDAGSWTAGPRVCNDPNARQALAAMLPVCTPLIEHKAGTAASYVTELTKLGRSRSAFCSRSTGRSWQRLAALPPNSPSRRSAQPPHSATRRPHARGCTAPRRRHAALARRRAVW